MRSVSALLALCFVACSGRTATVVEQTDAGDALQVTPERDAAVDGGDRPVPPDDHETRDGGIEDGSMPSSPPEAGDSGPPDATPDDPCALAPADFVCNGYAYSLTEVHGYKDVQIGNGYLSTERFEPFDGDKLVRRECVPVDDALLHRGFSGTTLMSQGDGADSDGLAAIVGITGVVTPELEGFAEHARRSTFSTNRVFTYAEKTYGPFAAFYSQGPVCTQDPSCGPSFVYAFKTAASVGIIVNVEFPTYLARDAFEAVAGKSGLRRMILGDSDVDAATAALAGSGAHVSLHVASSPALARAIAPLLRDSACSVREFSACLATYNDILEQYRAEVRNEASEVYQLWDVPRRLFDDNCPEVPAKGSGLEGAADQATSDR